MNSKLLYSHFKHEGKYNGKIKLEKHSHKKGNYRLQYEITHESLKEANFQLYNFIKEILEYTNLRNIMGSNPCFIECMKTCTIAPRSEQ